MFTRLFKEGFSVMLRTFLIRSFILTVAGWFLVSPATVARAQQTFHWANPAGGTWSVPSNWLENTAPTNNAGSVLSFGDPTPFSGSYTATNDLGPFTFTSLVFASNALPNPGTTATPIAPIIVTGDASNQLQLAAFGATLPTIRQDGTGMGTITANLQLVNDTTVTGAGAGLLTFGTLTASTFSGATLSGSANLTIDRSVNSPFRTGGYTVLNPASTAGFSGNVVLNNGNLVLAGSQPLGSGSLIVGAGTNSVQFGAAGVSVANSVQLNSTLTLAGSNGGTFTGPVNGSGGITVSGPGSLTSTSQPVFTFQGSNGFTGPVVVRPSAVGFVTASFSGANGTARSSSGYTAFIGGTVSADNTAANVVNRLNTAATVTLNGGTFQLVGNATAASSESLATLSVNGQGEVAVLPGSSTGATVTFGTLNRQPNSTLLVTAPRLAGPTNPSQVVFTADPSGAVGGGGGPGTTTQSVLPYAVANTATAGSDPIHELVRYAAATGRVTPLVDTPGTAGDEYARNLYTLAVAGATAQTNARVSDQVGGLHGSTAVNALVLESVRGFSSTSSIPASVAGSGTLTVTGGVVLATERGSGISSPPPYQLPGVIGFDTLAFGSQTGYLHTYSALAVTGQITGTGGLVKGGSAPLILTRANPFTGGLTANAGSVVVTDEAALGAGTVTLNGAVISFGALPTLNEGTSTAFTLTKAVTVGADGGGLQAINANTTLTASGAISGTGFLTASSGGLIRLTNTANSYSGGTVIGQGTLAVGSDAVLGAAGGNIVMVIGSTLQADASFTTNRSILLQGNAALTNTFFTNGNDLTLAGTLTSTLGTGTGTFTGTGALLKAGTGNLTLTALNTYTGPTTVGDQTPTVRIGSPAAAQTGGSLVLSGANGAIPLSNGITVNSGSALVFENSTPNGNRVGTVAVVLRGGDIQMLGNSAGVSSSESLGTVTVTGGVGRFILGQPGPGTVSTVLSLGGLAVDATIPGVAVIRGDNLGGSSGAFTQVRFGTTPTTVNGIIPFAVGGASASGGPTDFVAVGPNGAQLFTAYGSLASPGPTVTADQSGGVFTLPLAGATSLNALRLGAGGGVNLNSGTLTIGSTGTTAQAGAILAAGGANAGLTGGTLAFGGRTASITAVNDLTITSTVTGSAGLAKAGTGVLTLAGNGNGLSGAVAIGEGTLRYGAANALPTAVALTVNAGATLDFNGFSPTVASISGFGAVNVGTGNVTVNPSSTITYGGPLSGSGTLTKTGTGTMTLAGDNSGYTGGFAISNGLLRIETPTALGSGAGPLALGSTTATTSTGNGLQIGRFVGTFSRDVTVQATSASSPAVINIASGAGPTVSSNINLNANTLRLVGPGLTNGLVADPVANFTGTVSGTGVLELSAGSFRLAGVNNHSGGTNIPSTGALSDVLLGVANDSALGTGTLRINSNAGSNGVTLHLRADSGARTLSNPVVFGTLGGLNVVGTNNLTLAGAIDFGGSVRTTNVSGPVLTTFSGPLANGGLSKGGVGTLVLSNPSSTATGGIAVTGGLMLVNGSVPSVASVGVQGVSPPSRGGVLGGTGTVAGIQVVGGTVAPGGNPLALGNGVGTLTSTGALQPVAVALGTLSFDLNGPAAGTGYDQLAVGTPGQATTVQVGFNTSGTNGLTLQTRLGFDPTGTTLTLIDNRGTAAVSGTFAGLPEGATYQLGQFNGTTYFGTISYAGGDGNNVVISNIQPVPEPGSLLLAGAAVLGLSGWLRRWRHSQPSRSGG
jgi:autotransporter-associated beta strand protein